MPRRRLPYREGDWFAVPLRDGGYSPGRVVRMAPAGRVLLGYFFGPRRAAVPGLEDVVALRWSDAVLVQRFGDLGLVEGRWPILGLRGPWERDAWPMPDFGRREPILGLAWRDRYSPDDPADCLQETRITQEEYERLPAGALLGAGAAEVILTQLLSAERR